jgi:Cu-Zn family superoxide dismutase
MTIFTKQALSLTLTGVALFCLSASAMAQTSPVAVGTTEVALVNDAGKNVGTTLIREGADGLVLTVEVDGLTPGWHGLHVHAVGACDDHADHFKKAGSHLADADEKHGFLSAEGPHKGDLPNIWVHKDGSAKVDIYTEELDMKDLKDADGSALMIHAGADDYKTDPSGSSGDRLACGVIK